MADLKANGSLPITQTQNTQLANVERVIVQISWGRSGGYSKTSWGSVYFNKKPNIDAQYNNYIADDSDGQPCLSIDTTTGYLKLNTNKFSYAKIWGEFSTQAISSGDCMGEVGQFSANGNYYALGQVYGSSYNGSWMWVVTPPALASVQKGDKFCMTWGGSTAGSFELLHAKLIIELFH